MTKSTKALDPAAWAVFIPERGGVFAETSRSLGFTLNPLEIKSWRTISGAHKAVQLGKKEAIGPVALALWDSAEVLSVRLVQERVEALRKSAGAAVNAELQQKAEQQLQSMQQQWAKSGTTVTVEGANGEVVSREHYGVPSLDTVIQQIITDVRAAARAGGAGVIEARVQPRALPGVFAALVHENPGRLLGCMGSDELGVFAIFVEVDAFADWHSWWLCYRDDHLGLMPQDGAGAILIGQSAAHLRAELAARRREARQ